MPANNLPATTKPTAPATTAPAKPTAPATTAPAKVVPATAAPTTAAPATAAPAPKLIPGAYRKVAKGLRGHSMALSTITLVRTENPKRGASAVRYAKYRTGMTFEAYIAACGNTALALADLAWDSQRGFVTLNCVAAPAVEATKAA